MSRKSLQQRYFDRYFDCRELLCNMLPEIVEQFYRNRPRGEQELDRFDRFLDKIISTVAEYRPDAPGGNESRCDDVRRELKERRKFYDGDLT